MITTAATAVVAYLGLGSNLHDPAAQLHQAVAALARLPSSQLVACSPFYASDPLGGLTQPRYINAVVALATALDPLMLLHELQTIEHHQGRVRGAQRWAARTLDLDILLYGDHVMDTPTLTLPHPGIAVRDFVLRPLHDIATDLIIPALGAVRALLATCPSSNLVRVAEGRAA